MADSELLTYDIAYGDGTAHVQLRGDVDLDAVSDLRTAIREAQEHEGLKRIVLDFRAVDFVDSTGLSAVLLAHNDAPRRGQELMVLADDGPVRRAFELTGLAHILEPVA